MIRRTIRHLAVCIGWLSWAAPAAPAQAPAPTPVRVLPLRGGPLLQDLIRSPTPPVLKEVSLSPDGSTLLFVEAVVKPGHNGERRSIMYGVDDTLASSTVWQLDLVSGRRVALPGYATSIQPLVVDRELQPQWSADGRQVAFLEQRDADTTLSLLVWSASTSGSPTRIPLPRQRIMPDSTRETIRHWAWWSERHEVLLDLLEEPRTSSSVPPHTDSTWAWLMSPADTVAAVAAAAREEALRASRNGRRRLVVVNVRHQTVRKVATTITSEPQGTTWTLGRQRPRVLLSTRDPRHDPSSRSRQMWLLQTGDPRGRELQGMRSTLLALETRGGAVRPLYTGGPGEIRSVVELRGGKALAVVEQDPDLAIWPMEGQWARIRTVGLDGRRRSVVTDAVPLASTLYASDRPEVVFQCDVDRNDGAAPLFGIHEVTLTTGRRLRLNPADLSATWCAVSADGRTLAAVLEGVDTPPEVYVWTTATRQWRQLTTYGTTRDTSLVGPIEHLTWRSKDDRFDLDGFLVKPRNFDPMKRYPLLVFLQGGAATGTGAFRNVFEPMLRLGGPPAHIFAAEGYLVLLPNHRHTGGFSVEQARAVVGHYGRHLELDVEAGVDALIAKGWVNPTQLGIMGHSHGSDEVAYAISHTRRYKAAVIDDGPVPLPELYLMEMPGSPIDGREVMTRLIGYDPVQTVWADPFQIRTPLLLRWGGYQGGPADAIKKHLAVNRMDQDNFTQRAQTEKLVYALQGNNVPIDVIVDRDGHAVELDGKYMLEYQSRLLQWFDYFMLGRGEPPIPALPSPLDYHHELNALAK